MQGKQCGQWELFSTIDLESFIPHVNAEVKFPTWMGCLIS